MTQETATESGATGNGGAVGVPGRTLARKDVLAVCVLTVSFLVTAYGVTWQRGLHSDDYILRDHARDAVTGQRRPIWARERLETFPVRTLNFVFMGLCAESVPEYEGLARGLVAGNIALNSALLGLLVYRVLRCGLGAILAAWLLLVPFWAPEAMLWFSAVGYVVSLTFALAAAHAFLSAVCTTGRSLHFWLLGSLAFVLSIFVIEQAAEVVLVVPFLAAASALNRPGGVNRRWIVRAAGLVAWVTVLAALLFILVYRGTSAQIASRGGLVSTWAELAGRSAELLDRLCRMTFSPWTHSVNREALRHGFSAQLVSLPGRLALLAACASLLLLLGRRPARTTPHQTGYSAGMLLIIGGLLGCLVSVLLPAALVRGQDLERRLLYTPTACIAISVAGVVSQLVRHPSFQVEPWLKKLLLAVFAGATWTSATLMAGYAVAFAERGKLDELQLAAVQSTLLRSPVPAGTVIVPLANDERFAGPQLEYLSKYLVGVFEVSWSAAPEMARIVGHRDFHVIASSRWSGARFEPVPLGDGRALLRLNGETLDPARVLMFSYRRNEVHFVRELQVEEPGGGLVVFRFPLAEPFIAAGACPLSIAVPADEPAFDFREVAGE